MLSLPTFCYLLAPILVIVGSAFGTIGYLAFPPHGLTLRSLHELGIVEFRTASIVAERLAKPGIDVKLGREAMDSGSRMGMPGEEVIDRAYTDAAANGAPADFLPKLAGGHTGVVGTLKGAKPGSTVAIRVDVDALAILENTRRCTGQRGRGSFLPGPA